MALHDCENTVQWLLYHYRSVELLNIATDQRIRSLPLNGLHLKLHEHCISTRKKLNVLGMSTCFILYAWYYMYCMSIYRMRDLASHTKSDTNSQLATVGYVAICESFEKKKSQLILQCLPLEVRNYIWSV